MSLPQLPFTLYSRRKTMFIYFLGCVLFVAGGAWMIADGDAKGWLVVSIFSLGIPVFLIQLLPKSSYLTVSAEGLEFCSLYRRRVVRWSDVSEFGVYSLKSHGLPVAKMVGFNYSKSYEAASNARAFSKTLAGYEGGLPDTYGFNAEDLAKMLSEYHLEHMAKAKSK